MNLMISEALLQHTTAATHADVALDILFHATGESPWAGCWSPVVSMVSAPF
jgi:hypothetical protein